MDTKRLMDLVVSALGLVLLAPLGVLIALWIKLDSPGPVFFRQERVGRHGETFRIHKFRTMVEAPGSGGLPLTVGADQRVTRVGRFLRRTRLDELPQLLDVLRGPMSLVGPRPEVPRYVAHYPPKLRAKVLSVKPGITDPASLEFRDEAEHLGRAQDPEREYIDVILPRKLAIAARYVDEATPWRDLLVLLRSLQVLAGR